MQVEEQGEQESFLGGHGESLVAVTEITVEPRLIPPVGRGALMGLRSRTRFQSRKQP
jgi:hypothetical protein